MIRPPRKRTLVCEQCGAPLSKRSAEGGCLYCLLQGGIERESDARPVCPNGSEEHWLQHYRILTHADGSPWELGRGSASVTYKAEDVNLQSLVALKIISARDSARPGAEERFRQAARIAARLRHPNIASIFHFGTGAAPAVQHAAERPAVGGCFYAMEFVEGESLAARLHRSGPLPPLFALEMATQVARALAAAEKHGLMHQDLKPSRIMLVADEEPSSGAWVKVIGFGFARLTSEDSESSGCVARGLETTPAPLDRADILSLGAILQRALGLPLASDLGVGLSRRSLPASLVALLRRLRAPDPSARPGSAAELERELQRCRDSLIPARARALGSRMPGRVRRWALAGALAFAAVLVGLLFYFVNPAVVDKSIAVLPFRNLSSDPANAYFAEGVQDDIVSRLIKVRDLKVLSRTGTARFPADAPRDLRAIGQALGVRHLLEGSLRRDTNRVHLNVSLVDTTDGREVWAESYDRELAEAINAQGQLASDIAGALKATLSPRERLNLRSQTTDNPDAYMLFLRGRKLERNPAFEIAAFEGAEALYRQAVAVDPGFALAHARLAITMGLLYRFRGPREDLRIRAHAEAAEALRLQPELGEAHLAQGLCHYRIERDFDRAIRELETARRLLPNDTEPEITLAYLYRRQGQWRAALAAQEHVRSRDPLNMEYEHELHATACLLRDWPSAAAHATRALALSPKTDPFKAELALVDVWKSGDLRPLRKFFAGFTGYGDPEGILTWGRWDVAMLSRDFPGAHSALESFPFATLPSVLSAPMPKSYFEGCIYLAQGDSPRAQQAFEVARPSMEAEAVTHPDNSVSHARLGLLYAYMGRKAAAIGEGERAVQLTSVEKDAIDGHQWLCYLALILARVGETDRAISMIEALLQEPGCVSPLDEASMTAWELRLRWQWDPLRSDPHFQRILAAPEPTTRF